MNKKVSTTLVVKSLTSKVTEILASPEVFDRLVSDLRTIYGSCHSVSSNSEYDGQGKRIHMEEIRLWKFARTEFLGICYNQAGIQIYVGEEHGDGQNVIWHLPSAAKKKGKVHPRLMTSERFNGILNGALDSEHALMPKPTQQYDFLQDTLSLMLGKPTGDGGSSCGSEYVEWCVGKAELTLIKDKEGMRLDLRDLTS